MGIGARGTTFLTKTLGGVKTLTKLYHGVGSETVNLLASKGA